MIVTNENRIWDIIVKYVVEIDQMKNFLEKGIKTTFVKIALVYPGNNVKLPSRKRYHKMEKNYLYSKETFTTIFLVALICVIPFIVNAQSTLALKSNSVVNKYLMTSDLATTILLTNATSDDSNNREAKVIQTGRWLGAVAGSFMGMAHIYWRATGVSGPRGPMWKNLLTGIPSSVVGAYVGIKTNEWATKQIMKGSPKPGKATLKGMLYGAIDGAVTFTASVVPLLIIGHYAGTIHFNFDKDLILFKILGSAILGGIAYGGTFGAVVGGVSGPCISLYMRF